MSKNISRREFLKLGGLSLGTMAFTPFVPREDVQDYGNIARVTIHEVDVYGEPRDGAQIVGKRYRDQLVQIYYELEPADAQPFITSCGTGCGVGIFTALTFKRWPSISTSQSIRWLRMASWLKSLYLIRNPTPTARITAGG